MISAANSYDVFLSYSTVDRPHVLKVQEFLSRRGVKTFLDAQSLDTGMPWFDGLQKAIDSAHAVAIFVGRHGLGNWQQHEVAIAIDRQAKEKRAGRKLPVIPVLLPGVDPEDAPSLVRVNVWIRLTDTAADALALEHLLATVQSQPTASAPASAPALCPYRGLKAFREEDADLFFGRDAFAEQLLEYALVRPLVAAVGASGSGKSSVLQAGLLPRLRRQRPPGSTWSAVVFTPGKVPFHNLAAALYATWNVEKKTEVDRVLEAEKLGTGLADGGRFELAIRPALDSLQTDKLLIVVDQFEELFTLTSERDCGRFIEALLQAMDPARVILALTLRADFYGRALASSRSLSDLLQRGQVNLGPMQPQELQEIIERPAVAAGLSFEPGLVNRILGDVEEQPGALPLLEFALTELWQRRVGTLLTNQTYDAMGKVEGAIAQRAQTAFLRVPKDQQPAALRGLTRLVRVSAAGEEGSDTRQRVRLDTLDGPTRLAVTELTSARLLVTGGPMLRQETKDEKQAGDPVVREEAAQTAAPKDLADSSEVVEIAHEALIRNWPTLKNRLDEDRQFLLWRQRLRQRMGEWQQAQRDRGALLAGALLAQARKWDRARQEDLNDAEREFIRASELAEKRPRRWVAAAAVILLVLVAAAVGIWGLTRTDWYQVQQIVADISGNPAQISASGPEAAGNWVSALVFLGRADEAIAAASKAKGKDQSDVFASAASALIDVGQYGKALTVAAKLSSLEDRSAAFASIVTASITAGKLQDVERAAADINNELARSSAYAAIARALLSVGKPEKAEEYARTAKAAALKIERHIVFGRSLALSDAADVLAELGLLREAKDATLEAKTMAESIPDLGARSKALATAAKVMIKEGEIVAALEVATGLRTDPEPIWASRDRSGVISRAATALVKKGMAEQAFAVAAKAEDEFGRWTPSEATTNVTEFLVKTGRLGEAEAAASKLKDADQRSLAFIAISGALMKVGNPREALAVTDRIEGWSRRFDAADSILRELIAQDKMPGSAMLDTAKGLVSGAPTPSDRSLALALTSEILAKVGKLPEARRAAVQAQEAVIHALSARTEMPDSHGPSLAAVAQALIKTGELERAAHLVRLMPDTGSIAVYGPVADKPRLLGLIAEEWSKVRVVDQTLTAAGKAFAAAANESPLSRSPLFDQLAEAIIRVSSRPIRSLAEALNRIENPDRSEAFAALSRVLLKKGRPSEAEQAALAARSAVTPIDSFGNKRYDHDFDLLAAAAALIAVGRPEEALSAIGDMSDPDVRHANAAALAALAKRTPEQVFTALERLPNPSIRSEVFSRTSRALADAGKTNEAEAAAERASKAARDIGDGIERSKAFKRVATAWGYLGHLHLARQEAENCGVPDDQIDAYATILLRYAQRRGSKASANWLKKGENVKSSREGGAADRLLRLLQPRAPPTSSVVPATSLLRLPGHRRRTSSCVADHLIHRRNQVTLAPYRQFAQLWYVLYVRPSALRLQLPP